MGELSKKQQTVLRYLYEHRDSDAPTSSEISRGTGLSADDVTAALGALRELGFVSGPPSLRDQVAAAILQLGEGAPSPVDPSYPNPRWQTLRCAFAREKGGG
jgi:DNA-binding IclR family transcriptional regulator